MRVGIALWARTHCEGALAGLLRFFEPTHHSQRVTQADHRAEIRGRKLDGLLVGPARLVEFTRLEVRSAEEVMGVRVARIRVEHRVEGRDGARGIAVAQQLGGVFDRVPARVVFGIRVAHASRA